MSCPHFRPSNSRGSHTLRPITDDPFHLIERALNSGTKENAYSTVQKRDILLCSDEGQCFLSNSRFEGAELDPAQTLSFICGPVPCLFSCLYHSGTQILFKVCCPQTGIPIQFFKKLYSLRMLATLSLQLRILWLTSTVTALTLLGLLEQLALFQQEMILQTLNKTHRL